MDYPPLPNLHFPTYFNWQKGPIFGGEIGVRRAVLPILFRLKKAPFGPIRPIQNFGGKKAHMPHSTGIIGKSANRK